LAQELLHQPACLQHSLRQALVQLLLPKPLLSVVRLLQEPLELRPALEMLRAELEVEVAWNQLA